jgi:hypothetical protein
MDPVDDVGHLEVVDQLVEPMWVDARPKLAVKRPYAELGPRS